MARKDKTIIAEIEKLAKEKGIEVPATEGKSNEELETIALAIKNTKVAPPPAAAKSTDDGEKASPFSVASGKSITTKRGILADGEEIKKSDIPEESFKSFLKSGHIVKG